MHVVAQRVPRASRLSTWLLCIVLAGCATQPPAPPVSALPSPPPEVTRGQFTLHAAPLDIWNAIGQVVVRTPQASYDSRSQMMGLYSVHYRGEPLLLLAHALPLSDTIRELTTQVTARTPGGAPIDSDTAADLLAILQRELPAEVERVRARAAAAEAAEKEKAKAAKKAKGKKKK